MNKLEITKCDDGSYSAFSSAYNEHYHSTKDGALNESLYKHIKPAFLLNARKVHLNIVDICFGLGFNTLASLYYRDLYYPDTTLSIYSPELDKNLIKSLKDFPYPEIFATYKSVIDSLIKYQKYEDRNTNIKLFIGDAREYIKTLSNIDICYQDAFSPDVNEILWSREYFRDIANILNNDGVLTTYSIALRVRLGLYENGFNIYLNSSKLHRDSTVATLMAIDNFAPIDMPHKIACNPDITSYKDNQPPVS